MASSALFLGCLQLRLKPLTDLEDLLSDRSDPRGSRGLTFSLDKAMLLGFWAYSGKQMVSKTEKVNFYLLGVSLILTIAVVVQLLWK